MMVSMCLLSEVEVLQSVTKSMAIYGMVCQEYLSSAGGIAELWPCLVYKGCSLQYTF